MTIMICASAMFCRTLQQNRASDWRIRFPPSQLGVSDVPAETEQSNSQAWSDVGAVWRLEAGAEVLTAPAIEPSLQWDTTALAPTSRWVGFCVGKSLLRGRQRLHGRRPFNSTPASGA
jgi:hypothetical protein